MAVTCRAELRQAEAQKQDEDHDCGADVIGVLNAEGLEGVAACDWSENSTECRKRLSNAQDSANFRWISQLGSKALVGRINDAGANRKEGHCGIKTRHALHEDG